MLQFYAVEKREAANVVLDFLLSTKQTYNRATMGSAGRLIGVLVAAGPVAFGYHVFSLNKKPMTLAQAAAKPCNGVPALFLQGAWYNELGSRMNIEQSPDGFLIGDYCTAVESKKGAAGSQPRQMYGNASMDGNKNPTFGFTVVYKESTSSWSGQYFNERGVETLLTTWILTSKVDGIGDSWEGNRVGQDTFTRPRQE